MEIRQLTNIRFLGIKFYGMADKCIILEGTEKIHDQENLYYDSIIENSYKSNVLVTTTVNAFLFFIASSELILEWRIFLCIRLFL